MSMASLKIKNMFSFFRERYTLNRRKSQSALFSS